MRTDDLLGADGQRLPWIFSARNQAVWPRNSDSAVGHAYAVQARDTAFDLASESHITIEGFTIQNFAQAVYASSTAAAGIVVNNNDISKLRSENKYAVYFRAAASLVEETELSIARAPW